MRVCCPQKSPQKLLRDIKAIAICPPYHTHDVPKQVHINPPNQRSESLPHPSHTHTHTHTKSIKYSQQPKR
jgi:hypothetical protein